ncbi:hypothetical protein [Streptomyces lincolnensis]|uniref:hypothetical protein n=1 Tax=Streptomyces lincolnensis TaxID=1915 RepID=UPI0037D2352B
MRCLRGKAAATAGLSVGLLLGGATGCGGGGEDAEPKVRTVRVGVGETREVDTRPVDGEKGTTFRITVRSVAYMNESPPGPLGVVIKPREAVLAVVGLRIQNIGDAPGTMSPHTFPWVSDSGDMRVTAATCCLPGQDYRTLNEGFPPGQWAQGPTLYDLPEKGGRLLFPPYRPPYRDSAPYTPLLSIELPDA